MSQPNIKELENQLREKETDIKKLYKKIRVLRQHQKLRVSDHAIVRHMERKYKLDVCSIHSELVNETVLTLYNTLGDGIYPTGDGTIRVVIKKGVIVTVIN